MSNGARNRNKWLVDEKQGLKCMSTEANLLENSYLCHFISENDGGTRRGFTVVDCFLLENSGVRLWGGSSFNELRGH